MIRDAAAPIGAGTDRGGDAGAQARQKTGRDQGAAL
jgi:hypothetical protein